VQAVNSETVYTSLLTVLTTKHMRNEAIVAIQMSCWSSGLLHNLNLSVGTNV
jgi:hypothetical protein